MNHVDTLCRLIEFDTSGVDGSGCHEALIFLQDRLTACACATELIPIPPPAAAGLEGRAALLAHRRMWGRPRLLIYGHVDVVPAHGWEAYSPRREAGRVYGRGASDMKGGIAALVGALYSLRERDLSFDTTVLLTMDEETHQLDQLEYLTPMLDGGSQPHVLSLDAGFGYVTVAILGLLQMDITVTGESVHSALAHLGQNAIEDSARLMQALLELKQTLSMRRSRVAAHPSTGLAFMEPRLNLNMVEGGLARNVVPARCTFTIDRRLLPEETVAAAREEILAALGTVRGPQWYVSREFSIPPVPPCADPLAGELSDILASVTGPSGLYGDMLSGELPYAATRWGGDAFATGVIRPENRIHGEGEFVNECDLDQLVVVLARFLTGGQKEAA